MAILAPRNLCLVIKDIKKIWKQEIKIKTLQNIVISMSRRIELAIKTKAGATNY